VAFADTLFERINQAAILASSDLAAEKGRYEYSPGSDWETGAYFDKRSYVSDSWKEVREKTARQGMRNGYLMAVAPTSSTSIIAGTSAGIDPVMKRYYLEEKKGMIVPRVAPELSMETHWYYKNAHLIDQHWVISAAAARQRHIDQAQSLNLYITTDYSLRQVLDLYVRAWEEGIKTIYYVRSQSLEVEGCDTCSA
jgi:ribonucleoside-diphosphate reductase alpha chain